jgi:hypothetical protein
MVALGFSAPILSGGDVGSIGGGARGEGLLWDLTPRPRRSLLPARSFYALPVFALLAAETRVESMVAGGGILVLLHAPTMMTFIEDGNREIVAAIVGDDVNASLANNVQPPNNDVIPFFFKIL